MTQQNYYKFKKTHTPFKIKSVPTTIKTKHKRIATHTKNKMKF
jgi:hypothetical protein